MKPKTIRLFIKTGCPWCVQAEDWLRARSLTYSVLDVRKDEAAREEMEKLSGQTLAPVIQVDGQLLADFDPGQLEGFWKRLGYEH